jgi:putative aldouronate transport system substrate-binding protein
MVTSINLFYIKKKWGKKMNKNSKKIMTTSLAMLMLTSAAGCAKKETAQKNPAQANTTTTAPAKVTYPIKSDATLTFWCTFYGDSSYGTNNADLPLYKEVEKRTGVKIKWTHPVKGQETEQFNLMLASGNLPDIIQYNWYTFKGGPEKAMKDNIISPLNDLITKNAPNIKALLDGDKELNKMVKTDDGKYYVFPLFRVLDKSLPPVYNGPIVRKDWLDDLGMQVPTTIDEWEVMLKAFKEKKGADSPFTVKDFSSSGGGAMRATSLFMGAYGTMDDFFLQSGKVVYGPIQSGFKDYLALMRKWYSQGLIDKDFFTVDAKTQDAKMLSGKSGSTAGALGGNLGNYLNSMQGKDAKYDLVGTPYPTLKKGEKPEFGHWGMLYGDSNGSAAISAQSKNKDLAAQFLDYGYSKEGNLLYNFGIEGVSYNMVNGVPTYSELLTKNPNGLTFAQAQTGYKSSNFTIVQHPDYYRQSTLPKPQQQKAADTWMNTNQKSHMIPPVTATPEESNDLGKIMSDIDTYKQEMIAKFILGQEPIENFDKYVAQIKKLGIDKAITIKEAAIQRYNKR